MEPGFSKSHALVGQWHKDFRGQLERFLKRGIASSDDVNDLAQEVFLRLLRVERPELIRAPREYLYRIAKHVLWEWRSREKRAASYSVAYSREPLVADAESVGFRLDQDGLDVRRALEALPKAQAAALILRWYYGMTYKQIAAELDVTDRMVKRYIVKGYAALRSALDDRGSQRGE